MRGDIELNGSPQSHPLGKTLTTVPASGKLTYCAGYLAAGRRLNAGSITIRKLLLLQEFPTFVLHDCL